MRVPDLQLIPSTCRPEVSSQAQDAPGSSQPEHKAVLRTSSPQTDSHTGHPGGSARTDIPREPGTARPRGATPAPPLRPRSPHTSDPDDSPTGLRDAQIGGRRAPRTARLSHSAPHGASPPLPPPAPPGGHGGARSSREISHSQAERGCRPSEIRAHAQQLLWAAFGAKSTGRGCAVEVMAGRGCVVW